MDVHRKKDGVLQLKKTADNFSIYVIVHSKEDLLLLLKKANSSRVSIAFYMWLCKGKKMALLQLIKRHTVQECL